MVAPPVWRPPPAFDEYELIRPLGRGRVGLVYLAHDTLLDRHVAIKFVSSAADASLGRFLIEARAAARIQHPNVATLYRVGQLDGHPYLISELVRGTTLDRVPVPMPYQDALPVAIDLTRGLAAAHRRGVLHRDIKPGNAILGESGIAKLLDFGLAKLVGVVTAPATDGAERAGPRLSAEDEEQLRDLTGERVIGTPYFMAPEIWRGEQATERSDLFSLGLLLYELCAGRGPFRDVALAELPEVVGATQAAPVRSRALELPEGLAAAIDRCLRLDPDARFGSADELLVRLEALRPSRAGARVPEGNPYRGLRAFEPEHRALFFGRQRAISQALDRLRVEPFLLVTGDSGVGKSSLGNAGLLPLVIEDGLEDGVRWAVVRLVPGRSPALALAIALAPHLDLTEAEVERLVRERPLELGRVVRRQLAEGAGLLVYIDQLEELVTLAPDDERDLVSEAIGGLGSGLPGLRILGTARSDFLSRLEALPGLRERVARAIFLLAPLSRDEVREAVIGPAEVKQVRFESEAMVDALVDSTAAAGGGMPLLQFALAELWERREGGVIEEAALEALGGVGGALSRHADALIARLRPEQRPLARALLLRLVTIDRTRTRRLENELVAAFPAAPPVLAALVDGRLLVSTETPEGTAYEIAHEALVGGWDTLAGWLAEEAENRALIHRIETAASEWRRHGRSRELLWTGRQLTEVAAVSQAALTPREREFLATSRGARRRRRWLQRGAAAAVLVIAGAVWAGASYRAEREKDRRVAAALERADATLAEARGLALRVGQARAEAFAAYDAGRLEAGEEAWAAALELGERTLDRFRDASDLLEGAMLIDPHRADLRRRFAALLFERALLAEASGQRGERDQLARRMALYDDDGSLAARWSAPASLELTTEPAGAVAVARRYTSDQGLRIPSEPIELGTTPLSGVALAPGPVMLELRHPGREPVRHMVLAERGTPLSVSVRLPEPGVVPADMVLIPEGEGLFGSDDDESVRSFFNAVPRHRVRTDAFLIARHETTFGDWLAYLEELPAGERERRTPHLGSEGFQGMLALRREAPGRWEIELQPGTAPMRAAAGEPIRYPQRRHDAEQDWLRFPVVGISHDDARAYAAWLDRTGRLPGARLCTEVEWERAARGVDERRYPHGDVLRPSDANFDETYGKEAATFGPDEVGRHPASRSPFGVDDLAGNVWEWVESDLAGDLVVARGGSYYFASPSARIANRETPEPDFRDISVGMRVCASM